MTIAKHRFYCTTHKHLFTFRDLTHCAWALLDRYQFPDRDPDDREPCALRSAAVLVGYSLVERDDEKILDFISKENDPDDEHDMCAPCWVWHERENPRDPHSCTRPDTCACAVGHV